MKASIDRNNTKEVSKFDSTQEEADYGKSYTNQASDSSRGGGVSAIARNNDFGNVYGGTGWHYIKSGSYTWENNTKIGTTW